MSIRTKSGEIKPFIPNFAQKIVLGIIEKRINEKKPVRIRLLKARQLGFSTLFEAIIYAFTSRRQGFHSLVIAHDEEGSKGLFEMNKLYHEQLDQIFKPELKRSNEIALEFAGLKSRIDIDTSRNRRAGRSHTYQIVHKSESAYFSFPKEVNMGIANAVPDLPGTMIFDETTANGINFYYDEVQKSITGKDGYDFVFIPWYLNPEYSTPLYDGVEFIRDEDEQEIARIANQNDSIEITDAQLNWRRYTIAHKCNGDVDTFHQEYPTTVEEAFIFSGRPRFDTKALRILKSKARNPHKHIGLLEVYSDPDPSCAYVIGVDTSEGLETGDNSSVIILNCKTYSVAAEYCGKIAPDILANYIREWAELYNEALVVVEDNNHGLLTLNELKKIYQNLYARKIFDERANEWTEKLGFRTSARTKPLLIGNLDKAIRSELSVPSHNIIDELITYQIGENGDTNASEGKHDDRVIALALTIQGYLESQKELEVPAGNPVRDSLDYYDRHINGVRQRLEKERPIW